MIELAMAVEDAPQPRGAARRREIRMPVRLLATMTAEGGAPASVEVADISRGGACCRVSSPPPRGSEVALMLDGLTARAMVSWTSRGRLGLQFLQPLRASDILIQSGKSRCAGSPERHSHLAAAAQRMRQRG